MYSNPQLKHFEVSLCCQGPKPGPPYRYDLRIKAVSRSMAQMKATVRASQQDLKTVRLLSCRQIAPPNWLQMKGAPKDGQAIMMIDEDNQVDQVRWERKPGLPGLLEGQWVSLYTGKPVSKQPLGYVPVDQGEVAAD